VTGGKSFSSSPSQLLTLKTTLNLQLSNNKNVMPHEDIIRAWKDEEYRNSLSQEQRSQLPQNPAGMVELSDADMESVAGGFLSLFACGPKNTDNPVLRICSATCSTCNNVTARFVIKIC
jgi:mersacidin/lichenicidin family type 2 lantibiotic